MASLRDKALAQYKTLRAALDHLGGPGGAWQVQEVAPLLVPIKHGLDRLGLAKDWLPGLAPQPSPPRVRPSSGLGTAPVVTDPVVAMPEAKPAHLNGLPAPVPSPIAPPAHAPAPPVVAATQRVVSPAPAPKAPTPAPPTAPPSSFKFSWANRAPAASDPAASASVKKSLREIQAEEEAGASTSTSTASSASPTSLSTGGDLTEENLRMLEQGESTGSASPEVGLLAARAD
jgi:hypothetical protein